MHARRRLIRFQATRSHRQGAAQNDQKRIIMNRTDGTSSGQSPRGLLR